MVMSKVSAYEESRQKRLEENKKRMEELNLNKLAQALSSPKPSPVHETGKAKGISAASGPLDGKKVQSCCRQAPSQLQGSKSLLSPL
ncbi:AP2/B3-like transcriptional factor family protein [Actinidia rufa]|uniref:AP2/B3-like transcriptional factor family protein n=1 Tax=Actinidia rufa TaxID=165716 RepID=A0A7J0H5P1_9ERIC|nr:AP2/B3-like transcriptional factor family protein [Actinidia rufa]